MYRIYRGMIFDIEIYELPETRLTWHHLISNSNPNWFYLTSFGLKYELRLGLDLFFSSGFCSRTLLLEIIGITRLCKVCLFIYRYSFAFHCTIKIKTFFHTIRFISQTKSLWQNSTKCISAFLFTHSYPIILDDITMD